MIRKSGTAILILLLIGLSGCIQSQPVKKRVVITGALLNFNERAIVLDHSEMNSLLPGDTGKIIRLDPKGRFTIAFELESPNYFKLGNFLYLQPGDSLDVVIDYLSPQSSVFKGRGAEINTYLSTIPWANCGSYLDGGINVKSTAQQTIDTIFSLAQVSTQRLERLQQVSAEFKRLETARIRSDILNSLYRGPDYTPKRLSDSMKENYAHTFDSLAQRIIPQYANGFIDTSFLKIWTYRYISRQLVKLPGDSSATQNIKDWLAAERLAWQISETTSKTELLAFEPKINNIQNLRYRNALMASLQHLFAFGKGDTAADFVATDAGGKKMALSSMKGKVIFIDIWATWCAACLEEMPDFNKLKERYKTDTNIVFISLSIDSDVQAWKRYVKKHGFAGQQWLTNSLYLNAYNVVGIPRRILINKNFIVEEMNASLQPAEGFLEQLISEKHQ